MPGRVSISEAWVADDEGISKSVSAWRERRLASPERELPTPAPVPPMMHTDAGTPKIRRDNLHELGKVLSDQLIVPSQHKRGDSSESDHEDERYNVEILNIKKEKYKLMWRRAEDELRSYRISRSVQRSRSGRSEDPVWVNIHHIVLAALLSLVTCCVAETGLNRKEMGRVIERQLGRLRLVEMQRNALQRERDSMQTELVHLKATHEKLLEHISEGKFVKTKKKQPPPVQSPSVYPYSISSPQPVIRPSAVTVISRRPRSITPKTLSYRPYRRMEDEVIHVAKISQQEQLMIDRLKQSAEQKEKDVADEEVVHVTKISMGERAMLERMAAEQEDEPTTPTVEVDTVSKPITQSPQVVQTQETKITQLKSWELERELVRDPRLLHTFVEALYYYHDSDIHKLLQGVADTVDKSFPEHKVTKKVKVTKIGGVVKTGPSQCLRPHRQHLQDQQASSQLTRLTTAFTRMDDTNKGFITPKQLVYCLDSDPTIRRLIAHSCFASPQLVLDLKQLVKTLPSQTRVYPKDLNSYITSLNR